MYSREKRNEIISLIDSIPKTPNNIEILSIPIDEIVLSTRAFNVLSEAGIKKLSDLLLISPVNLYAARNIGKKTIYEIRDVIEALLPPTTNANIEKITPKKELLPLKEEGYVQLKKATFEELIKTSFDEKLLNTPIEELDITIRSFNVLQSAGCKTINDIVDFGLDALRRKKIKNCGRKSIENIKNAILMIQLQTESTDEISFTEAVENILASIERNHLNIIKARYGYDEGKRKTLEEIGNRVGVTRERVRQILVAEIRRIKHPSRRKFLQTIIENIERLLLHYKGIISINDMEKDKYFSGGERKQLRFLRNIIVDIYEKRYRIINKHFLTSLGDSEIKAFQFQIREAALNCQFPIDEDVFLDSIRSSIGHISKDYLIYHLLYREHIEISKGKVLSPGRLSIPQRVKRLMRDIDRPMHFTEIARLYKNQVGYSKLKTIDLEHAIHTRIGDSKDFIIVEPGTFILRDKFKLPANIEMIAEMSKEILRNLKSVSDTRHLINELEKRNIDVGNLNAYSLKNILLEYPGFVSYRKFEIGLEELADKYERKPLSDLIHEILISASKPMHLNTIWKQILKQRGFPRYAIDQRLADDSRFIKVAPATYTVAENIPRYEEKQKIIIDFAKEWINLKRNAISAFFISEVLKETSEIKDIFLGLVENVLATSPEFIKLPNGFYDLAKGTTTN